MWRVLLISNHGEASSLLGEALANEGFETIWTRSGQGASISVHDKQPEIVVLDGPVEDVDSLELCRHIRGVTDVPIVMLAPDARETDIVRALESGADEYLLRPVGPRELAARLRALMRRANHLLAGAGNGRLTLGDVEVDDDERRVYKRGQPVELSPTEYRLLVCLLREAGRVVSHRKLMAQVWGGEYVQCRHYLRLYIRYLRSKLEDDPRDPKMILNEWGTGYRLAAPA
jgi:two-component system KDP operon response regulator KdpE